MARQANFRGKVIVHPGAEVFVDLAGMVQPGIDLGKVLGLVGEAPNGEPGLHIFADAEAPRQVFGDGSVLADAAYLAMRPSNDERVDGSVSGEGAVSLLYVYKANQSTQAERWLVADFVTGRVSGLATGSPMALAKDDPSNTESGAWVDVDLGATYADGTFNNLICEVISGFGKGQQSQIAESKDQGANVHRLILRPDLDWDVVPDNSVAVPSVRVAVPKHSVLASEFGPRGEGNEIEFGPNFNRDSYLLNARYNGRQEVVPNAFGGQIDPTFHIKFDPTGGGALSEWTDPTNWIIPQALDGGNPVQGTTTAAATNTVLENATNPLTVDVHINRWAIITGVNTAIAGQTSLLGKMFKIVDNGAASITLAGAGLDTNLTGANLAGIQWKVVALSDVYVQVDGENGQARTLKIFIKDGGTSGPTQLASVDLSSFATLSALEKKLDGLAGISSSVGDGVDSSLSSDRFDFGALAEHHGPTFLGQLAANTLVGATSLSASAVGGLEGSLPLPTVGYPYYLVIDRGGANEEIVVVTNNVNPTLTVLPMNLPHTAGEKIERVTNIEAVSLFGSQLVFGPGDDSQGYVLRDNAQKLKENAGVTYGRFLVERAVVEGSSNLVAGVSVKSQIGAALPENNLGVYRRFYNGEEGLSYVNRPAEGSVGYPYSWQDGLDKLLMQRDVRVVVPCVSENKPHWSAETGTIETLLVRFQNHLIEAEANRSERQGYFGLRYPLRAGTYRNPRTGQQETFTRGALEWIRFLNEERLSLTAQDVSVFTTGSTERLLEPWALACMGAGVQLGVDIGEGLTFKKVNVTGYQSPYNDWDADNRADSNAAILGGLFFVEGERGFYRIVRGNTTHVSTDNLARTDINVWAIRNLLIRNVREQLEDRFIGGGVGNPGEGVRAVAVASVASIREAVTTILKEFRADGYIVDSTDAQGNRINAFTGLKVTIKGDIARIRVQVFPKTALNFIFVDFNFQLPQFNA